MGLDIVMQFDQQFAGDESNDSYADVAVVECAPSMQKKDENQELNEWTLFSANGKAIMELTRTNSGGLLQSYNEESGMLIRIAPLKDEGNKRYTKTLARILIADAVKHSLGIKSLPRTDVFSEEPMKDFSKAYNARVMKEMKRRYPELKI